LGLDGKKWEQGCPVSNTVFGGEVVDSRKCTGAPNRMGWACDAGGVSKWMSANIELMKDVLAWEKDVRIILFIDNTKVAIY
jgi:hypothetical protein